MIYNPSYKENPHTKIEILEGARIVVWKDMFQYTSTLNGDSLCRSVVRSNAKPAIPGIYWVNSIFNIPHMGIYAVCLHDTPQVRYATYPVDNQEYIAWGVPVGQYLTVQP